MALRKKNTTEGVAATPATVSDWSVADLSALYAENRSSLVGQARRILRSEADAAEIVQEAFLKFILAAPELDTADRALAYLRTTVNNLCLNQIRSTGSRPNLVAIDSETSQERLAEISLEAHIPFDTTLAAAEDASIIREALSRLSADQRTALVMWEMEGRSTEEIAKALGTKPENVRHVVGRARASFVRVLTEWVIDEATGTTALEALSTQYKKAAELAKKSSKVALSLLIVLVAFLGFNSVTGQDNVSSIVSSATTAQDVPAATNSATPSTKATPAETAKKADAQAMGADDFIANPSEEYFKKNSNSFDLILNTVSVDLNLESYLSLLRLDGTLVLIGLPGKPYQVPAGVLLGKRRRLAGSMIGGIPELQEMLNFCGEKNILSDVEVINANYINQAYERTVASDVKYRFVIDAQTF